MNKYYKQDRYKNQVIREKDKAWFKDMTLVLLLTLLIAGAVIFYVWQQVERVKYGYKIEQMREEKSALEKQNRELKLERSYLRRLDRIEKIAKNELHMSEPGDDRVIVVENDNQKHSELQNKNNDSKNK